MAAIRRPPLTPLGVLPDPGQPLSAATIGAALPGFGRGVVLSRTTKKKVPTGNRPMPPGAVQTGTAVPRDPTKDPFTDIPHGLPGWADTGRRVAQAGAARTRARQVARGAASLGRGRHY